LTPDVQGKKVMEIMGQVLSAIIVLVAVVAWWPLKRE
jgi:hypothetical protein